MDLEQSDSLYADIKLEILMPRVIVGSNIKHKIQSDKKPSSLQVSHDTNNKQRTNITSFFLN